MPAFFDYIRNITYYLLFASLAGMIAPSGKYKKYVSMVMGFILLALLLQPLRHFVGIEAIETQVTQWLTGAVPGPESNMEDAHTIWQDLHLSAAFEAQLAAQLEGFLLSNGIAMHEAGFTYTSDFSQITSVRVLVSRKNPEEYEPRRIPFIRIEPIGMQAPETEYDPLVSEVKNLIAGFYNLQDTHIYVEISGQF